MGRYVFVYWQCISILWYDYLHNELYFSDVSQVIQTIVAPKLDRILHEVQCLKKEMVTLKSKGLTMVGPSSGSFISNFEFQNIRLPETCGDNCKLPLDSLDAFLKLERAMEKDQEIHNVIVGCIFKILFLPNK